MPITPSTFLKMKGLAATHNYRAYADVFIMDPTRTRLTSLQCLVDTGSDYTILPIGSATAVGITPTGPQIPFTTASGVSYILPSHQSVDLLVEGYPIQVEVVFATAQGFHPIIGRLELIAAFDLGFDINNWYWA